MEAHSQNTTKGRRSRSNSRKLFLEDYIDLLHTRSTHHFSMNHLNLIINMHGFKKIHRASKKVLAEAVDALDLILSWRSTLGQSISSFAVLALEDIVSDLNELNWQECCVTSIETINSGKENSAATAEAQHQIVCRSQEEALKVKGHNEIIYRLPEPSDCLTQQIRPAKWTPKRKKNASARKYASSSSPIDCVSLASC